jgi:hypothetical protein
MKLPVPCPTCGAPAEPAIRPGVQWDYLPPKLNILAGIAAYKKWREVGDTSPSNLVHAILHAAISCGEQ